MKWSTFIILNLEKFCLALRQISEVTGIERMSRMGLYLTEKMAHKLMLEGNVKIG